ncbi:hypothetical protein PAMA_020977 [Pampus argenteus]
MYHPLLRKQNPQKDLSMYNEKVKSILSPPSLSIPPSFIFMVSLDLYDFYHYFYMLTNVLFYVSSAINPILYNLVSATYRQIFFSTLRYFCVPCHHTPRRRPHPLTRHSISISSNHTLSTNIIKETAY